MTEKEFEGKIKCKDCGKTWAICECEKEFNLSDRIVEGRYSRKEFVKVKYVREFIKRKNNLNEEIVRAYIDTYLCREKKFRLLRDGILREIKEKGDKLAGEKLV